MSKNANFRFGLGEISYVCTDVDNLTIPQFDGPDILKPNKVCR